MSQCRWEQGGRGPCAPGGAKGSALLGWIRVPKGSQDRSRWVQATKAPQWTLPCWEMSVAEAAICLPAPANPLLSPDTHTQTLVPSSLQSRKTSAFGRLLEWNLVSLVFCCMHRSLKLLSIYLCCSLSVLVSPDDLLIWLQRLWWVVRTHSPSPKMQSIGQN